MLIEDSIDGIVWLSLKPCTYDHSFELQLRSVSSITSSRIKNEKLMATISMLIFVVRQEYKKFIIANEAFITSLLHILPNNRKDISMKVDPTNTTLYVYEDYPLRSGIYLERDSFVKSKPDNNDDLLDDIVVNTISRIEDSIKRQQFDLDSK
jgi:hypothetical protein